MNDLLSATILITFFIVISFGVLAIGKILDDWFSKDKDDDEVC